MQYKALIALSCIAPHIAPHRASYCAGCQVRRDIRDFRAAHALDTVIVMWTANTERFSEVCVHIAPYCT